MIHHKSEQGYILLFIVSFAIVLLVTNLWSFSPAIGQTKLTETNSEKGIVTLPDKAIEQTEKRWEKEYEDYFQNNLSDTTLDAAKISKKLANIAKETGKNTAVIWIASQPDQLDVLAITPGKSGILRTVKAANKLALMAVVKDFRERLTSPRYLKSDSYLTSSQQLYEWLVGPVENELKVAKIDTIMFCLGGGLRGLPIAALYDGKQFIIAKYSVARIPAFNMISTTYKDLRKLSVLAMGASQFSELNPLPAVPLELSVIVDSTSDKIPLNKSIRAPLDLADLVTNQANPDALSQNPSNQNPSNQNQAGLWPGKSFLNQEFTLANLQAERKKQPYGIIHLATHAEFKSGNPHNSFIQLWNDRLTLDQMRNLGWADPPVELLTLSACKTAVGDQEAEMGFAGLAVQSGVKAALASLWYVSDAGTLALMSEFYQQLRNIPFKAEALRQAQLAMLNGKVRVEGGELRGSRGGVELPPELSDLGSKNLVHPYYWAAFTIIGNPW